MTPTTSAASSGQVTLREPRPEDTDTCARILFEAFGAIHDHHRFPRDFPVMDAAMGMMQAWIPHPSVWGVVAEIDGEIVGSNFLDERNPIRGVGPITVDPEGQNAGVGRKLMEVVIERGERAPGIRLLQDGFHMRSLALYQSLGFDVKDPAVVMKGKPGSSPTQDVEVRPLEDSDLDECETLCVKVHGFPRIGELRDALHGPFRPFVALRGGSVCAYATMLNFWPMAHGVAETDEDMHALLIGGAAQLDEPIELLAPLRWDVFRWCRAEGLRLTKPMNLMARGEYQEPTSAWFPSVIY
jgi:GNAT superfamily N-acetyltransferase